MKNFHVTVMSIDPDDHSEDNHQKYGLNIQAKNEKEAAEKGKTKFLQQNSGLPVFWVKAFESK
jgi:hypothetical protein